MFHFNYLLILVIATEIMIKIETYINNEYIIILLLLRKVIYMLKMKKISETYDMRVFTDTGDYFGDVEEAIIQNTKINGWRVRATKNSFLNKVLGSAKGVIIPHNLVKSIGDIMIINRSAIPNAPEGETE